MKKAINFNYKGFIFAYQINGKLIFKNLLTRQKIGITIDKIDYLKKQIDLLS